MIDWNKARSDFISDLTATYRTIGQKYGVDAETVQRHNRCENWQSQRQEYSRQLTKKLREKMSERGAIATADALAERHRKYLKRSDELGAILELRYPVALHALMGW